MIKGKEFHNLIGHIFDNDVKGLYNSEQLQVNCPKCQQNDGLSYPDGKYNLEINTAKRVFRCWRCDSPKFSGSLGKLIKIFGTYSDYEIYKTYGYTDYFPFENDNENDEDLTFEVTLPKEIIYFSDIDVSNPNHIEPYVYMVNDRQIERSILIKNKIGFCVDGFYRGRIIIPSFDSENNVNYFISRTYKKNVKPVYLNPKINKNKIIFNENQINWDSTIYIVEGAFEMFSVINAIPQLGTVLSESLFYKLKEIKPQVIIILDPDAIINAISIFQILFNIYVGCEEKIKIVKLKGDDDLDKIRRIHGRKKVLELLYGATLLSVDDFIKMRECEYGSYSK